MIALQSFNPRMPLISSQHFPIWVAIWMSILVRPCNLASARHVQLSIKMLVAVSMSMNQSSSFEESCPSNVGISWSMVVVRFDSLCVVHKRSMWACMVFALVPHWAGGWLEHHGEVIQFICELWHFCCGCGLGSFRFLACKLVLKLVELF